MLGSLGGTGYNTDQTSMVGLMSAVVPVLLGRYQVKSIGFLKARTFQTS